MIIRDHRLEHGLKACTTVFQLLPLQNLHFLMTKPPTQKVLTIFLFLISKPHWWTRIKVTYMPPLFAHIQSRRGCQNCTNAGRLWLEATRVRFPFTYWWKISEIEEQDNQPIIISSSQEQQQTQQVSKNCPPIPGRRRDDSLKPR